MLRPITNFLYRRKDPTRDWVATSTGTDVDLRRCTLGGVPLGGPFAELRGLGPSEDAARSARGYPQWYSQGVYAIVENQRITEFTLTLVSGDFVPFSGTFLVEGKPAKLTSDMMPHEIVALLGEPFGRSVKEAGYVILFYEFAEGEVQFACNTERRALESIEFQYEPELSDRGACEYYGIERLFPEEFRRTLRQ